MSAKSTRSPDTAPTAPALPSTKFLQLVADPQRWTLLHELARSDRRVNELSALLDRPQNLVSYHLRELRSNGLVSARRSSADGRDTYYRIELRRCRALFADAGSTLHPGLRLSPIAADVRTVAGPVAPSVLFLCTGNSSRSQIAEALLEHRSASSVAVRSAGSAPKPLHPRAVEVMAARGIDISTRHAKHLDQFADARFDHVITLCDKVREICPELPGHPVTAHWSIADPAAANAAGGDPRAPFDDVADEIDERVDFLLCQLAADATAPTTPTTNTRRIP